MSLSVLVLVLTAAVLHATWNLLAKKAKGKAPFIWLQYVVSNLLFLPFLFFQLSQGHTINPQPLFWFSIGSAVLHLGYFLVLQKGYRSADLSVVYPLARGSAPLVTFSGAILFLHEKLKPGNTLGLLLIIAGVLTITRLSFNRKNNSKLMAGIIYGMLTGLFIALYTFNDTVAVKIFAISPVLLTLSTGFFSAVFLTPFVLLQKDELKREIREHKWIILAIAVLSPAAYILVLEALKYAPLSVVAPARETSILLGVFMGSRVFNEKDGKRRLIAGVLIIGGIIALSVG
jgi:drug/metabolite transporter (DMT)-like permease